MVAEGDGEADARFLEEFRDVPGHLGEGLLVAEGVGVVPGEDGQVWLFL